MQLYRGSADGCRASYYLLDELFTSPLAKVPLWRALGTLLRAQLALVARAGAGASRTFLARAVSAIEETERTAMPCCEVDVLLLRAVIAVVEGRREQALQALDAVLRTPHDATQPPLALLFALRARGQVQAGSEGKAAIARAEEALARRGVVNPRRFARLFLWVN